MGRTTAASRKATRPLLCTLLGAALLLCAAQPAGAAPAPKLSLSPSSGEQGDTVLVSGRGFRSRSSGRVTFGGRRSRAFRVGAGGRLRVRVRVPSGPPGRVRVLARASRRSARATFRRERKATSADGRGPAAAGGTAAEQLPALQPSRTAGGSGSPAPAVDGAHWRPGPSTTWQIQLSGGLDSSFDAVAYDIDGFDTPKSTVTALKAAGRRTICYFSAGSYEDWRPDGASFPPTVLGASNGWPGERWLDIRRIDLLAPIIEARLDMCREKGFDAVDPDNVDGYTNATGFPLTAADQLTFNRYLADAAHARGMAVGLKNDLDQVGQLVSSFDFAVNEQCFQYRECDALIPFIRAGKPVFGIEYSGDIGAICAGAQRLGFMTVMKRLALDAPRTACW